MATVLEEADESNFWLTFIQDTGLLNQNSELENLMDESNQLSAIFTAALKTSRGKS
jgi:four helix bundle protein